MLWYRYPLTCLLEIDVDQVWRPHKFEIINIFSGSIGNDYYFFDSSSEIATVAHQVDF